MSDHMCYAPTPPGDCPLLCADLSAAPGNRYCSHLGNSASLTLDRKIHFFWQLYSKEALRYLLFGPWTKQPSLRAAPYWTPCSLSGCKMSAFPRVPVSQPLPNLGFLITLSASGPVAVVFDTSCPSTTTGLTSLYCYASVSSLLLV